MYLVSADAFGNAKGVGPGGAEIEKWDAYGQPTGIHYNPWSHNHEFQSVKWLDFQWCQTGHAGEHRHEKVAEMRLNKPVRAVANGEPSYERICRPDRATGWWQGHEQWCNLMAGGTMGVVYGAGGIWQWKLDANEPGWEEWCNTAASWKDALSFEGARYVGRMGQVFDGLPFADMEPRIDLAMGKRCVGIEGRFCVIYLEEGGGAPVARGKKEMPYRWFDPMNGTWLDGGTVEKGAGFHHVNAPEGRPLVLVVGRS